MRAILPILLICAAAFAAEKPFHEAELIFPLETWHNHASSIVELPNGDLFVCWYHGSGEKGADDVRIEAARKPKGSSTWSQKFTLADTPGFPDTNPMMFLDRDKRLWLVWQVIVANEWHTALTKYKISTDYLAPGPPKWASTDEMLFVPRNFGPVVKREIAAMASASDQQSDRSKAWQKSVTEKADDKYFSRMGWMTRVHPLQLPSGRILVPLYSDGYSFSLIAISDDNGVSWSTSEPLVGGGNVQPTLVRKKDGAIVAYFRDNGPAPKRIPMSVSHDNGITWSRVVDTDIPNPGTSVEVIGLRDGKWALVYNDLERGRNSLAISISDDEGATWKWTRHLDRDMRETGAGQFHYPSVLQAQDGSIHVTYSYYLNDVPKGAPSQTIKHARFNVAWVQEGDPRTKASAAPAPAPGWSAKSAAAYLDARAEWWSTWPKAARDHDTFCVSCHTALPYALSRASLRADGKLSAPEAALLANITKRVEMWNDVQPFYPDSGGLPRSHQSRVTEAILNALILSKYNSPLAPTALKNMWALQIKDGADAGSFPWLNFHNEPWEAEDSPYFGNALAAMAAGNNAGPDVDALKNYLRREFDHQTEINKAFALWAGVIEGQQKAAAVREIVGKQAGDGGWSLAYLIGDWKRRDNTEMSKATDGYATALMLLALQGAGEPKSRKEIKDGLAWLNFHQERGGFWISSSPNVQRDPESDTGKFMSDAATAYAVLALTRN